MCTRIFWNNDVANVAARTFDWAESDEPRLWVLPQGLHVDCAPEFHRADVAQPSSPAAWSSRFGSIAVSGFGNATTDAVNERGLAVHLLYLAQTQYAEPDDRPAVPNTQWVRWIVDNFATVADAVVAADDVRVVSVPVRGEHLGGHIVIEDPSGDSAVIEIINGRTVVHHGAEYTVVANDPQYDEQLANVDRYRPFGGDRSLPGDILSADRFVRASYFLHYLPEPETYDEAVAGPLLIARNVAVPPGAPYDDFSVYPTRWISATDVTNRIFYFQPVMQPNLAWVALDDVDLRAGAPIRSLDPSATDATGDLASKFTVAEQLNG